MDSHPPDLSRQIADEADQQAWRGSAGSFDEDEAALSELLLRRIWNRWEYDAGCLCDADWNVLMDALDDCNEHNADRWKPGLRLEQAERAFMVLMGLWCIAEHYPPSHWKHKRAKLVEMAVRQQETITVINPKLRRLLVIYGKHWLAELREMGD